MKSWLAVERTLPSSVSHMPSSRNGTIAEAAQSLALRGTFASGSQRNSCWLTAKAITALTARAKAVPARIAYAPTRATQHTFETYDQIGGRQEQRKTLNPPGQHGERKRGSGKKQKRGPQDLVDHLGFLRGIRDAGDDQPKRGERDDAQRHQEKTPHRFPQSRMWKMRRATVNSMNTVGSVKM